MGCWCANLCDPPARQGLGPQIPAVVDQRRPHFAGPGGMVGQSRRGFGLVAASCWAPFQHSRAPEIDAEDVLCRLVRETVSRKMAMHALSGGFSTRWVESAPINKWRLAMSGSNERRAAEYCLPASIAMPLSPLPVRSPLAWHTGPLTGGLMVTVSKMLVVS